MPPGSPYPAGPEHRADIDGLRGIAVLTVVLYHAFPGLAPGGLIGVDIFFVISGFLISSILFSGLERGRSDLPGFYLRRIRRIFPALITVIAAGLAFGWAALLADEYRQLGKYAAAGCAFISNFVLLGGAGYFGNASEANPMLHLWSLAIEEQFYLFWPLLLALFRKRKRALPALIGAIAALSFAANLHLVRTDPSAAFYLPFSRFWELMIGGLLAYIALHRPDLNSRHRQLQSLLGFALLAAGLALIDRDRRFPGGWALLPCMGAALLISAGPQAFGNRAVLSNRALVWFGLISYPLYLWHWPLLSFAKILTVDGYLGRGMRCGLVAAAILLAWLTYAAIESPLRYGRNKRIPAFLMLALALTGGFGYACMARGGFPGTGYRDPERTAFSGYFRNERPGWDYFEREHMLEKFRSQCDFYDLQKDRSGKETRVPIAGIARECFLRDPAMPRSLMLWGDSHAFQLYSGLRRNLPADWQILQVTSSGCPPEIPGGSGPAADYCAQSNRFAWETIKRAHPDAVILAQKQDHDADKIASMGAALRNLGIGKVFFLGPTPHWRVDLPKLILRKLWRDTPARTSAGLDTAVSALDEGLRRRLPSSRGFQYLSLIDYFCDAQGCLIRIGKDRMAGITSWDQSHLTPIAADAFARDVLVPRILAMPASDPAAR